jgi:adenosylmethionine-8-amino-7-oxononanoate aminotransferase
MSDLVEKDKRYTWHPYTQHQTERDPVVITRAKGACLYDEDGNEMLDMISSWWTCVHGHSHPELNKALVQQAETAEHVMFAGFTHAPAANIAEKLANILPGDLNRTFFSDNGSTAVEVALKLAYQYWKNKGEEGRTKFLAFDGAYHGDTVGAMAVGRGCGFFNLYEDLLFQVQNIPYAETWDGDEHIQEKEKSALKKIEAIIKAEKDSIAALIVEPLMQGAGGIRFSRPEFMKAVTDLAHENGLLVIYDEVAVGFGRCGSLFACQKIGVTPDFICLSKGLTAGYMPMAVTVTTNDVFDAFLDVQFKKAFMHSHTFMANPLACAVALKSLQMFDDNKVMEKIAYIESRHRAQLKNLHNHSSVFKPRVMGPCLAFNLTPDGAAYKTGDGEFLREWYLKNGLNIRPLGDAVYLMPPYCITDEQLDRAYAGLYQGLDALRMAKARAA